ncbi:MAG: acyl carrier protein [Acholeplasmatales bacterium]|nr:acyl carrier protein [Acholeplasmatales bacterium]
MDVFAKVKEIIISELNCAESAVTPEAKLRDDLGADSIDAVQIVMEVEDAFGVTVDDTEAEAMETVGDVVKYIENNLK